MTCTPARPCAAVSAGQTTNNKARKFLLYLLQPGRGTADHRHAEDPSISESARADRGVVAGKAHELHAYEVCFRLRSPREGQLQEEVAHDGQHLRHGAGSEPEQRKQALATAGWLVLHMRPCPTTRASLVLGKRFCRLASTEGQALQGPRARCVRSWRQHVQALHWRRAGLKA